MGQFWIQIGTGHFDINHQDQHNMPFAYETNPQKIEQNSFRRIRELTSLTHLNPEQQQVALRIVHSLGLPQVVGQIRFSDHACERGMEALAGNCTILCDVEMVKQGVTKRMINKEPLCFLHHPHVAEIAKQRGETRSMTAVAKWAACMDKSVVIIGNAPTALFRLLETIEAGSKKPALVIGMPVGFIGAAESKQALWDHHKTLGIECITLLGQEGGSAVASATCNALLRCNRNEHY